MVIDIAFTAYPANDVAATRAWYERCLGFTFAGAYCEGGIEKYNEAHFPSGCFSLMAPEWVGREPGSAAGVAFEVDDIERSVRDLRAKGVIVAGIEEGPVCKQTTFCDPEGNKVTIHQKNAPEFDLRSLPQSFYANPYPVYRALRESDPVHALPGGGYFLTRYADLSAVYRDTATFSSDKNVEFAPKYGDSPLFAHHTTSLVFNDPPLHTRVRKSIMGALSPRVIGEMEPAIVALVDDLLDTIDEKRSIDVIEDFASAIPIEVIGNLLGVPREERGPLRGWSLAILGALEPTLSAEQLETGNAAVTDFTAYLRELVRDRRRAPGDPERDVLTRLIAGESDGVRLTEDELLHNCIFILNAGHETTTNLIGNALQLLIEWPDERERLLADPGLLKTAVEEFLRFESSNQLGNRRTTCETQLGGITLAPGTSLTLGIGAANRDPEQFPDPERLDIGRTPNRHLAFASGPHQCSGMNLARLEGSIAIDRFVRRFPHYRTAAAPVRGKRARFRGFTSLAVWVAGP